jgi:TonB family protein
VSEFAIRATVLAVLVGYGCAAPAPAPTPPSPPVFVEPPPAPTAAASIDAGPREPLKLPLGFVQVETVLDDNIVAMGRTCFAPDGGARSSELTVGFRIDPSGAVVDSWLIRSAFHDRDLEECVVRYLRGLRFPSAEAPTLVQRVLLVRTDGIAVVRPSDGDGGVRKGLSAVQVRSVVTSHAAAIRACYDKERQANPGMKEGVVRVAWEIEKTGVVGRAWIAESTLGNASVEECVLRQIRAWQFEASDVSTKVAAFPFKFAP